jgi:hypothetical protein
MVNPSDFGTFIENKSPLFDFDEVEFPVRRDLLHREIMPPTGRSDVARNSGRFLHPLSCSRPLFLSLCPQYCFLRNAERCTDATVELIGKFATGQEIGYGLGLRGDVFHS